jgi:hypothetical protein
MIPGVTMPEATDREIRVPVITATRNEEQHAAPGTALSLVRQAPDAPRRRRSHGLSCPFTLTRNGRAALAQDEADRPEDHPDLVASRQMALKIRDRRKQASDQLTGTAAGRT